MPLKEGVEKRHLADLVDIGVRWVASHGSYPINPCTEFSHDENNRPTNGIKGVQEMKPVYFLKCSVEEIEKFSDFFARRMASGNKYDSMYWFIQDLIRMFGAGANCVQVEHSSTQTTFLDC